MKDLIGREVEVGQYIAYALTAGRSANLAIYHVREVSKNSIKAHKVDESYTSWTKSFITLEDKKLPWKHVKFDSKLDKLVELPDEEKAKIDTKLDNKVSTLSKSERIFILNDFSPELFE